MNQQHRYTGRELSALLDQVRRELGAEATIHEANKIRTGGVAGFFRHEAKLAHAWRVDDESATRKTNQLPPRGGVPSLAVAANIVGVLQRRAGQRINQGRFTDAR